MSQFKISLLSDSMLKRISETFALFDYADCDGIHAIPGSEISRMKELAEQHCVDSNLIVINCGINNVLNGQSPTACIFQYDRIYKAITSCCKFAHVAFTSVSYVATNRFTDINESPVINPLVKELNTQLQEYCQQQHRCHFINLTEALCKHEEYIDRSNLSVDGLHYSRVGLVKVARVLITQVKAIQSVLVDQLNSSLYSENINTENEKWPELPAPSVQTTVKHAIYPGQQFVVHSVHTRKQNASTDDIKQSVKIGTVLTRTSEVTKEKRSKQHVHMNVRPISQKSCSKLKSSVHNSSEKKHSKQCHVNSCGIVLSNKFSVLCSKDTSHGTDNNDDESMTEYTCKTKVCCTGTSTKKTKFPRETVSFESTMQTRHVSKAKNTMNVDNRIFRNPYRVSTFSTLTWTKSCFIQKSERCGTHRDVRRTFFTFEIVPRLLHTLKLPVSDSLVQRLLVKYGIRVSVTNTIDNAESSTMFSNADSLIKCLLKVLLQNTRPSNATFLRVIHKTGIQLLKYDNLYGTDFLSRIDGKLLSIIRPNTFDIDLLLLCGDIESNPGPRKQTQEMPSPTLVPSANISSQNQAQINYVEKLTDCFGHDYRVIRMEGSGFCGFHCLSFCLTGRETMYADIIDDCINVFANIQQLFRLRTNFGGHLDSSLTLHDYSVFMNDAIEKVRLGLPIDIYGWCEDAHFAAISLLYDISIFIYSQESKNWHVFNESASRGFICLINSPGHFDVLLGSNGRPTVPIAANTHCVNRQTFHASADVWQHMQRSYSLQYVFCFPTNFSGVRILNSPLVPTACTSTKVIEVETNNGVTVLNRPPVPITGQTKKSVENASQSQTLHTCDHPGCNYANRNANSVTMHRLRCHKTPRNVSAKLQANTTDTNVAHNKIVDQSRNVHACHCGYIAKTSKGLCMHRLNAHQTYRPDTSIQSDTDQLKSRMPSKSAETANKDVDTESFISSRTRSKTSRTISDVSSVTSVQSQVSRRSDRIAKKHIVSSSHGAEFSTPLKDTFVCHIRRNARKRFASENDNGQAVKRYRHAQDVDVGTSCSDLHSEVNSHTSVRTRSSARSDRTANTYIVPPPREKHQSATSNKDQFVCDVIDCGQKFSSKKGLSIHKGKCHKKKLQIEVDAVEKPCNRHSKEWSQRLSTTTKIYDAKVAFSKMIKNMQKEFVPKCTPGKQVDPLYDKLKKYHDLLLRSVTNFSTEKLSSEVLAVLINPAALDDVKRQFTWSKDDEKRLNELNRTSKLLQPRSDWTWGHGDYTERGLYNDQRMQLCVTKECQWKLIECNECGSTGLLVGYQTLLSKCYDCEKLINVRESEKKTKQNAWNKVRPVSKEYPKTAKGGDLPYLQPGDKAVIAPVHPVVTIKKNSYANKRLRLESISLVQDPTPTWCKILPRTSLSDRFMIIERRVRNSAKYVVANPDRVRQWLRYLFLHHKDFISKRRQNELAIDEAAIETLGPDLELAEVDNGFAEQRTPEGHEKDCEIELEDNGLTDATTSAGFSETHVFSFDRYPELYLKTKDVMRIRKEGKLQIIKDDTVRRPTYCVSANLAFPHLYPHGEMSPLDFGDYKLGRYLLKKQALFAHRMGDGRLQFHFSEDDIHMAHQYSRLSEQTVRANVGYYLSSHPSVAHVPLNNIVTAFRDGVDKDCGLLDSHLPDLTHVMTQLPNSRAKWFSERLAIEAISRDIGSPNLFVTINLDPRASPDVRRLIYKLEHGTEMNRDEPFVKDTAEFTRLMSKYAAHVSIYLYRKVKIMMRTFFTDICGIPEIEPKADWTEQDVTETGWFWGRVEFTETRGFPHFHYLVKLPHVLDTGLLGRIIHNGRVVRQELKCGNIKPEKREEAWQMIEMGLLASRYAALFAHSISMSSFYSEEVGIDDHDDDKVSRLEDYRQQYAKNYKEGNITLKTHPIMRRFDDAECDPNQFREMAQVASVSCLHQCIRASCGGDPLSGDGCRFDFPRKELNHTVAAVMQVNANQMEARILLRRTCDRVANLNRYLIRYLRSNHDVSVLIDSAHKLRYATKYCAKSGKHTELLDEMIEHLTKRSTGLLPPNMKQTLSHLLLADCSHRAFISKQELAYRVMGLPDTMKSFQNVDVVGFFRRANLQVPYDDEYTIEYSDRTEYSAYAERCRDDTERGRGLTKEQMETMSLNDFAQTVQRKWINTKKAASTVIDETTRRKFRSRDVNTGHWRFTLCSRRKHTRPSTVLHTAPAIDYEFVEHGKTTTQTTFFDLPIEKRHQLYRCYYELVMYVPWKNTPDETFLSKDVLSVLDDKNRHPEIDSRYSLQRLEEFFKVYRKFYNDGKVAVPGSAWQKDNQFAYSMYLVNQHNRDIHLDRVDNKGILKAQYEDVDELVNVDVDIRTDINDVSDLSEYPTFENFMPPDIFRNIMEQKPPELSEICVAFPLQHQWQRLEEVATHDKAKRFIANPPISSIDYTDMTPVQKFAVDRGIDMKQQILFLCGKAGSGKTAVALKICDHFRGKVQATAYTGKAASLFNGPTIHSLFGWSHNEHRSAYTEMKPDSKKVEQFRVAHEGIDLFVIEEALAVPAACFALMDEMMTAAFNPKHVKNSSQELPPFGGKKILFLGDQSQLPPIGGPAVYDDGREIACSQTVKRESKLSKRSKTGQLIFEKYLVPNCVYFQTGQRNCGLLGEICDRMRHGKLTEEDCTMLTYQRTRFPDVCTDYGIHYQNDMCAMHNWRQLWNECLLSTPRRRFFICHSTYHVSGNNDDCVDALKALPPQAYDYAPDILCVAEGCEVRLLQNINTAAGLVTSQCGTVVKVIYNNSDANLLLSGEHVVPYCIIVSFSAFQGFIQNANDVSTRIFPFPNQRTWVPVFRKRFNVKISSLPTWVRKKQLEKDCYRVQFPLDLSNHITAHRAQGQTLANCLVSVDLGLADPDMRLPPEISSILYVACTRATTLENLFVGAIHPTLWSKIGQNDIDKYRRSIDDKLQRASEEFAANHGMYQEMLDELAWTPDYSQNAEEWRLLQTQTEPPKTNRLHQQSTLSSTSSADFFIDLIDVHFPMFSAPVLSERHIGIDQGVKNFAIAVVERTIGKNPHVVRVKNYTDLDLKKGFRASDVVVVLTEQTDLMSWMSPVYGNHTVDRVIVHLEQIDVRNRNSKQFSAQLGKLLQQQATDVNTCIVKMSQPHILRATGPLFRLGDEILEALNLQPALYNTRRSRAESNPSVASTRRDGNVSDMSDVEPDDVVPSDDTAVNSASKSESQGYRIKKKISSDVFRYIVEADEEKMTQMKLTVDDDVKHYWRAQLDHNPKVKLDDAGDALLHALDELLCGSANFKQLVPKSPSVHVNRTVAIAVFPDTTYWIVLNCRWNTFLLENFGWFNSGLRQCFYKSQSTVDTIKESMYQHLDIRSALRDFEGSGAYDAVDHIKVVVKQLTGHTELGLSNIQAGALTESTTKAMKLICDGVIGINSKLCNRRDNILGSMYVRTSTVHRDRKFQVVNSTGKHTNAVLSCLSWMRENMKDFVVNRREFVSESEKRIFFNAISRLANSTDKSMEMLQLSDAAKAKLTSRQLATAIHEDKTLSRNIADLILIAVSKNQKHVKAIAANSRQKSKFSTPSSTLEHESDVEPKNN